jgi:enoyl-CoA hydratase
VGPDPILLDLGPQHAHLTFNRPEARNALSSAAFTRLEEAVTRVEAWVEEDPRHIALLLSSSDPRAFVSGADLKELRHIEGYESGRAFADRGRRLLARLEDLPVPVVAALEGPALGGGVELALACDFRVVSEISYFSFVQLRVGIVPGWGGGRRLAEIVGWKRALFLLGTAAKVSAPEALRLGLADRLAPAGQALQSALEVVDKMSGLPPLAVLALKPLLRHLAVSSREAGEECEADTFGRLWASGDHDEALSGLLDGTAPTFKGR